MPTDAHSSVYTLLLDQRCNSYCIFCGQRLIDAATRKARAAAGLTIETGEQVFGPAYSGFAARYTLDTALADLREARGKGATALSIQGGEPTLWPQLAQLITATLELGFARVGMVTNARRLADADFARSLVEAGLDHVTVSLLGSSAASHDSQSLVPGSFEQAIQGIQNLRAASSALRKPLSLNVNYIISRPSVDELPAGIELLAGLGVDAVQAHVVKFDGLAADPKVIERLAFDIRAAEAPVREAIRSARRRGISLHLQDLPPCLHPELTSDALLGVQQVMAINKHAYGGAGLRFEVLHDRERSPKPDACRGCWFEDRCARVGLEYLPHGADGVLHALDADSVERKLTQQLLSDQADSMSAEILRLAELMETHQRLQQLVGPPARMETMRAKFKAAAFGLLQSSIRAEDYADSYAAFRALSGLLSPREVQSGQVRGALASATKSVATQDCDHLVHLDDWTFGVRSARLEGDELVATTGSLDARHTSAQPRLLRGLRDAFILAPLRQGTRLRINNNRAEIFQGNAWRLAWALTPGVRLTMVENKGGS